MSKFVMDEKRLESLLPLLNQPCDVFKLVAALHTNTEVEIQDVLCSKLYEAKSHEIEFFLPQLCNIILNRASSETEPLLNFILEKCRLSLHIGLLVHFIFQGAVEDQKLIGLPESVSLLRCKKLLKRCTAATISSSKDKEMANIIRLFTTYQIQKSKRKASQKFNGRTSQSSSFSTLPPMSPSQFTHRPFSPSTLSTSYTAPSSMILSSSAPKPVPIFPPASSPSPDPEGLSESATFGIVGPSTSVGSGVPSLMLNKKQEDDDLVSSLEASFELLSSSESPWGGPQTSPHSIDGDSADSYPKGQWDPALVAASDEFTDATYHTLIRQHIYLTDDDSMHYDFLMDYDITDLDNQLELTPNSAAYAALSTHTLGISSSLPRFDVQNPQDADRAVDILNDSILKVEQAYLATGKATKSLQLSTVPAAELDDSKKQLDAFCTTLDQELMTKRYRQRYFRSELHFVGVLTGISSLLKSRGFKTKDQKTKALRICLKEFNFEFSRGVYMPVLRRRGKQYRVIRIPYKEAFTLNSRDRVPYMIFIEAVHGEDQDTEIQSRPYLSGPTSMHEEDRLSNAPIVSIRDAEDQVVSKVMEKLEIIDEWVVVDKPTPAPPPPLIEKIYGESWASKCARIQKSSPVGYRNNWELISVVMKSGDDLRQEQLATQLIRLMHDIFQKGGHNLWLYPYEVLAVSSQGGFIETIPDALSIHSIKEVLGENPSLSNYFAQAYPSILELRQAKLNFVESLAGYSLVCYLLQIKDRHNGNILLDTKGHLIHIDYGFMLSSSPGSLGFESAPFKLTEEFIEVMDGRTGALYHYFRTLFTSGFLALREHAESILSIVQMMEIGSKMACFNKGPQTMVMLEDRFKRSLKDEEAIMYAESLITASDGNWRTGSYDTFQSFTNGIKA